MWLVTSLNHSFQVKRLYSRSTLFECCQTYFVAPWSLLRRQNREIQKRTWSKAWLTLLSLTIPPFWGGCANDKIMSKIYIWIKRTNSPSPQFLPLLGGIMHILHILGGYWHILLFRMCKKWGDKSFISLARIINSSFLIIAHYLLV